MQVFSLVQFLSSIFLTWNNQTYDYERWLRIWRYVSFSIAILFNLIYLDLGVTLYELISKSGTLQYSSEDHQIFIQSNSLTKSSTSYAVYDAFFALTIAYFMIIMVPAFVTNGVIIAKECTMDQTAQSKEEDYQTSDNFDMLSWFNVNEDPEYYKEWIKDWMHEYI